MRIVVWVAVVGAAAALLAGCGDGAETTAAPASSSAAEPNKPLRELRIALDAHAGAENVGILMAQQLGYFEDIGLSVSVGTPLVPRRSVRYVADRTDEFGVAQLPQVALAVEKGNRVVAIGSLLPHPTAAMIWLKKSQIDGIADLKGKTVAVPGVPFQEDFLRVVLRRAGLSLGDVEVKDVGHNLVPALVSGRADAIFGGSSNLEGARLESRGLELVVTPVRRLGVPAYDELVVVAHGRRAARGPKLIRDFMAAIVRGNIAAIEDPEAAVRAIRSEYESDRDQSLKAVEAQVEATLPLLSETGDIDPARATRLLDWMYEQGMLKRKLLDQDLLGEQ